MGKLTYELQKELLDIRLLRGLREKLEIFATDKSKNVLFISLETVNPSTGRPVFFEISKEDLTKMGFIEIGGYGSRKPEVASYIKTMKELTVEKVFKKLDSVIRLEGNNKVILVPMFNTGDPNLGYQVLRRITPGNEGFMLKAPYEYLPKDGYIKLDTNDPNYKLLLDYSIRLMQSGRCAFVMKKWQDNIGDLGDYLTDEQNFIMGFNRERILGPEENFSPHSASRYTRGYENFNVRVGDYSTSFRPVSSEWEENWVSKFPLNVYELMSYFNILLTVNGMKTLFLRTKFIEY